MPATGLCFEPDDPSANLPTYLLTINFNIIIPSHAVA
jgi:hypothetical protein